MEDMKKLLDQEYARLTEGRDEALALAATVLEIAEQIAVKDLSTPELSPEQYSAASQLYKAVATTRKLAALPDIDPITLTAAMKAIEATIELRKCLVIRAKAKAFVALLEKAFEIGSDEEPSLAQASAAQVAQEIRSLDDAPQAGIRTGSIKWAAMLRVLDGEVKLCDGQMYRSTDDNGVQCGVFGCLVGALAMDLITRKVPTADPEGIVQERYNLTAKQVKALIELNDVCGDPQETPVARLARVKKQLADPAFQRLVEENPYNNVSFTKIHEALGTPVLAEL